MIKSVSEPPIWKPTLPPSIRTVPGADQPLLLRQDRYPLPYFAPKKKAAVFKPGTITMQWAFSSNSCGMPLSGADITSEKTSAASFSRLAGSLLAASSGARAKVVNKIDLMCTSLRSHPVHVPCHGFSARSTVQKTWISPAGVLHRLLQYRASKENRIVLWTIFV